MSKITKAEEVLENGQLIRVYGQKTLLGVTPAYRIDKVKFSIVDLNSGGREFIDVYLSVEEVRQLCREIDNGIAAKRIAEDKGNYPTAYTFTKGKDGCKKMAIGGGMKGVRIQMSDSSDKQKGIRRKMALIQMKDLVEMSFMFKLSTGMVQFVPDSYYGNLYNAFKTVSERNYGGYNAELDGNFTEEDSEATGNREKLETVTVTSSGKATTLENGNVSVPVVIDDTGESTEVVFSKEQTEKLSWFKTYAERTKVSEVTMTINAVKNETGKLGFIAALPKKK